jgi:hypothetical protein
MRSAGMQNAAERSTRCNPGATATRRHADLLHPLRRPIMVFIGSQSGRPSVRGPHSCLTSALCKRKFRAGREKETVAGAGQARYEALWLRDMPAGVRARAHPCCALTSDPALRSGTFRWPDDPARCPSSLGEAVVAGSNPGPAPTCRRTGRWASASKSRSQSVSRS